MSGEGVSMTDVTEAYGGSNVSTSEILDLGHLAAYAIPSLLERVIEATVLSAICLVALVGNLSLWYVVCTNRSLSNTSNALVLCLSTADLLVSAVNMPITVYTIARGRWVLGDRACVAFGFISMVTFIASVMSLGVISFNRYVLICHPHKFKSVYSKRNTTFFILGTWLLSALLALPPLVGWGKYAYLPNQSFCFCAWKTSISYTFFMVGACFGGPCTVMSVCYFNIMGEIRASRRRIAAQNKTEKTSERRQVSTADGQSQGQDIVQPQDQAIVQPQGQVHRTHGSHTAKISHGSRQYGVRGRTREQPGKRSSVSASNSTNSSTLAGPKLQTASTSDEVIPLKTVSKTVDSKASTSHKDTQAALKAHRQLKKRKENIRLAVSFLVVILVFVISWLPFCVTMFLSVFSSHPIPRAPDIFTLLLGCLNSVCNPIIYGIMNSRFRAGFRKLYTAPFRRWCKITNRHGDAQILNGPTIQ